MFVLNLLRLLLDLTIAGVLVWLHAEHAIPALVHVGWNLAAVVSSVALPCGLLLVVVVRHPWIVGAR